MTNSFDDEGGTGRDPFTVGPIGIPSVAIGRNDRVIRRGTSQGDLNQFFIDQQTFVPLKTEVTEQNKGNEMEVAVPLVQHITPITVVWKNEDSWDQDM